MRKILSLSAVLLVTAFWLLSRQPASEAHATCQGEDVTIDGTSGPDTLTGTSGPDVIHGFGGVDVISGAGGRDLICAGTGNDTVKGGAGNDSLEGGAGDDELNGGLGNDLCFGGPGTDVEISCADSPVAGFVEAFPGVIFDGLPIDIDPIPGQQDRYLVSQLDGQVLLVDGGVAGLAVDVAPLLGTPGIEEGLFALAFDPAFSGNSGSLYMYYGVDSAGDGVLSRFELNGDTIDLNSEDELMRFPRLGPDHNGGSIEFGPDGFLYMAIGDGGCCGDPFQKGQDIADIHGKVLRLDVSGGTAFGPPDNPFAGPIPGNNKIWAYGFRNPWRMSFDSQTGKLYLGDVGQDKWEEIDVVVKGGNYGWVIVEGPQCYPPGSQCDKTGLRGPFAFYQHLGGRASVTGGYVYRGSDIIDLHGWYVYADYATGEVFAVLSTDRTQKVDLFTLPEEATSFGQDSDGELFMLTINNIYRLVAD
ncbi:MAG: PQQ-dependent sugar dehydrogenase [Dehalococcoidia bacterium]